MKECSLALSGSGLRFPVFIGVYQALLDAKYEVTEVAGTSGGAIVSAFVASGFSPTKMLEITHNTSFTKIMDFDYVKFIEKGYMDSGDNLLNWLESYLEKNTFKDLAIPFTTIASNLNKLNSYVFNAEKTPDFSIALACRISSSLPVVYQPYISGDLYLVDGGVSNDLPVKYLTKPNIKFAVNLLESEGNLKGGESVIEILSRVIDTFLNTGNEAQLNEVLTCVPIKITTAGSFSLDTNMTEEQIDSLYKLGYDSTMKVVSNL